MSDHKITALADLLRQAGAAHGEYEIAVLNGVYDEAWADWYADWLLANGFGAVVRAPQAPAELSALLADLNRQHRASDGGQHWADFYAARIAAILG